MASDLDCDISGYRNIHFAIWKDDLPKLESILANPRVDVNAVDIYDNYTALSYAIRKDNPAMVRMLLDRPDINLHQEDAYRFPPLHYLKGFAGEEVKSLISDYLERQNETTKKDESRTGDS